MTCFSLDWAPRRHEARFVCLWRLFASLFVLWERFAHKSAYFGVNMALETD
jgi:hypothetical protein